MKEIDELTERLRSCNGEQFCTLVKMHLSFVLDLNTEDADSNGEKKSRPLKWNLPFVKKIKNTKCSEASTLTNSLLRQITILTDFLKLEENIVIEGIFRRTGKLKRQQELKTKLIDGEDINLIESGYSVHDCASVLKNLLSELPEPLLTDVHFPAYCQVAELKGNTDRLLLAIQLLTLLLPNENRTFVREILMLLHLAANHQDTNRMSPSNLATLFTPHLMCPRKLSPEALHSYSQLLSNVVAFMIEQSDAIFLVPDILATDIRAYWEKKERRQRSPLRQLNESVCDGTTVSTVYTFVDREKTAQENGSNPTELALAQLYAHIQSLPDSAMKRRLVKNFNKKNGQGTPAVRSEERKHRRSKSLRDSIKKHLPGFNKGTKGSPEFASRNIPQSPEPMMKTPLLPAQRSRRQRPQLKQELLSAKKTPYSSKENTTPLENLNRSKSCEVLNASDIGSGRGHKRPSPKDDMESSSAKRTPQLNLRAKSMRSNPVLPCASGSLVFPTKRPTPPLSLAEKLGRAPPNSMLLSEILKPTSPEKSCNKSVKFASSPTRTTAFTPLKMTHEEPRICNDASMADLRKSEQSCHTLASPYPSTPLSVSSVRMQEPGLPFLTPTNRIVFPSTPRRFAGSLTTSTPAPRSGSTLGNGCLLTPHVERNSSMSPITRSAQRMTRAMQETMMTPRSRKPVVSLSGTDLCHLTSLEPWTPMEGGNRQILEESEGSDAKADSLSTTFRDYLFSRSVLTASPVDLSFSSRTDDYQSLSSKTSSLEDLDMLAKNMDDKQMSESLLFCLDGNDPDSPHRDRPSHVCETAI